MERRLALSRHTPALVDLTRLARSSVALQVSTFTGASVLASVLGGISTILLAHGLSIRQYGSYSFAVSALAFGAMFFEFGLFLPPARQLARSEAHQRETVAAATVTFLPVGVVFTAGVMMLSLHMDTWFHVDAGAALRLVAPLVIAYPYEFVAFQLAQGLHQVGLYSVIRMLGRVVAAAALVTLLFIGNRLTVASALVIESVALMLAWGLFTVWLRPHYRHVIPQVFGFVRGAREYGFQVYLGRVLSVGSYNLDTLLLAALTDARSVGLYALASRIAYVVGLPGAGIAATLFSRMAREPRLQRGWLTSAWVLGLLTAALACLFTRPFLRLAAGNEYLSAAGLLPPLAVAEVIRSVTALYNTHLSAHARGAELRNAAIVLTVANLLLSIGLIPPFGAVGAAWASVLALLANLAVHIAYYRRVGHRPEFRVPVR
jgi:O-antigen/teichoic acid export membrane protein